MKFEVPGLSERLGQRQSERPTLHSFSFTPNPGVLVAKKFVPERLAPGAALVVVLHGCTQTPEGYDRGTGWIHLAARHGFVVLYPEQQRSNNGNLCFNWFEPGDMRRDAGEPASIKAMIDAMIADHAIDPARVFITGLSAGGAMAGVMLATYPEVFAGGGLIAGLPYASAQSMPAALTRMRGRGRETSTQLGDLVRGASNHSGRWPTVSVWHGSADATVHSSNADATVEQWRSVHGLGDTPALFETVDGYPRSRWRDDEGRVCVEEYQVTGMGHGTPLDPSSANREQAGAFLLSVGISSTRHLARSWGIIDPSVDSAADRAAPRPGREESPLPRAAATTGVHAVIENALRSAGLMR